MSVQHTQKKTNAYINIFEDMDTKFDNNECTYHVDTQLKEDNKLLQVAHVLPKHDNISVILRKKKTHTQLITYLHRACFSPVKSTFLSVI